MGLLQRPDPVALMVEQIGMTPDIDRLRRINSQFAGMDGSTLEAIVEEAARFGGDCLKPLNAGADREGCRLESGRVRTPPGFAAAWRSFVEGGWPTLDQPIEHGGQG